MYCISDLLLLPSKVYHMYLSCRSDIRVSWDSLLGIVTRLCPGCATNRSSFTSGVKASKTVLWPTQSLCQRGKSVQTGSMAYSASYPMSSGGGRRIAIFCQRGKSVQTGSMAYSASYPMGNEGSVPGRKAAGVWRSPLFAEVRNDWSYISNHYMPSCLAQWHLYLNLYLYLYHTVR